MEGSENVADLMLDIMAWQLQVLSLCIRILVV